MKFDGWEWNVTNGKNKLRNLDFSQSLISVLLWWSMFSFSIAVNTAESIHIWLWALAWKIDGQSKTQWWSETRITRTSWIRKLHPAYSHGSVRHSSHVEQSLDLYQGSRSPLLLNQNSHSNITKMPFKYTIWQQQKTMIYKTLKETFYPLYAGIGYQSQITMAQYSKISKLHKCIRCRWKG